MNKRIEIKVKCSSKKNPWSKFITDYDYYKNQSQYFPDLTLEDLEIYEKEVLK